MKRKLFRLAAIFLGLVFPLFVAEIVLRFLPVCEGSNRSPVNQADPIAHGPKNRDFIWSKGWNFSIQANKHSNNYGYCNDQDYVKNLDEPLMVVIGDSFIEALQVDNHKTCFGILSERVKGRGRVYSVGVGGAQLVTYLKFAEFVRDEFRPDALVFVIIGNDYDECLDQFPSQHYFEQQKDGKFAIRRADFEPSLVRTTLRQSALFRYLFLDLSPVSLGVSIQKIFEPKWDNKFTGYTLTEYSKEKLDYSQKVVAEFFRLLPSYSGLNPDRILFLMEGLGADLLSESELQQAPKSYAWNMHEYFKQKASEGRYEVVDMVPHVISENRRSGAHFRFPIDGHWNEEGHKLAADLVSQSKVFRKEFEPFNK